jgi:hypothetical protein
MLTITDLHNEQELSSFEMRKVVGAVKAGVNIAAGAASGAAGGVTSSGFLSLDGIKGESADSNRNHLD